MQVSELHFLLHHTGPPKLALSWQHCCTQAWKFTAVIAGCSLLILFNNSLAKSLKLAVKPTCREYALGSGSPPRLVPEVQLQIEGRQPANTKAQPNTINMYFECLGGAGEGHKKPTTTNNLE